MVYKKYSNKITGMPEARLTDLGGGITLGLSFAKVSLFTYGHLFVFSPPLFTSCLPL